MTTRRVDGVDAFSRSPALAAASMASRRRDGIKGTSARAIMKTASTDAACRTLHLLLEALEAGGVSGQIFALVLDDRGLRVARVSRRRSRARLDGVDARRDLARAPTASRAAVEGVAPYASDAPPCTDTVQVPSA